jgi:hypothetical protein
VDKSYKFTKLHIDYPLQLIDPADTPNLQQPYGCVLDIIQVIAEFLLSIDYEDIIKKPEIMVTEDGEREISTYTTGNQFEKICETVHKEYGEDVYPLIVQFNSDGMPIDALGMTGCFMLSYVTLCYLMLPYVTLCYLMFPDLTLCYRMLRYVFLR